jgi:phosphohistidine phosphatase
MKTLLILRHAKSSWKKPGLADHDRPLNKRGKGDAPRMGQWVEQQDLVPDLIITSTANRARVTAEVVAENSGYEGEIQLERSFYMGYPEAYLEVLRQLPDEVQTVMVVGHNPGLEELLEELVMEPERLPTAALARIDLPIQTWQELDDEVVGELVNLWRPREL